MTELLFYQRPVALDKHQHRQLRVGEIREYRFSAKTNSVPLAIVEFFETAREYPIVFTGTAGTTPVPTALLSLRSNENLFVGPEGHWQGRYIPAFIRRYPFVLSATPDNQLIVCVDESHSSVGAPNGRRLFDDKGEPSPFLANAIAFMDQFQAETLRTREFVDRIVELDLLTEMSARAELDDGGTYQLDGFSVIDETRYRALDKDTVDELFRKGWLALIDAHLLSLGNLGYLINRLAQVKESISRPSR